MPYSTTHPPIALPILPAVRAQADKFAREQPTGAKAGQVYRNTLAVLVVDAYLQLLDIPTQLETSHCWQSVDRLCSHVSDLHLPQIGRLECCPVGVGDRTARIFPDSWSDRLGYVFVELNLETNTGRLLGFLSQPTEIAINVSDLQPLTDLLPRLQPRQPWQLGQWLSGQVETGWQQVESLLSPERAAALVLMTPVRGRNTDRPPLEEVRRAIAQMVTTTTGDRWAYRGSRSQPPAFQSPISPPLQPQSPESTTHDLVTILTTTEDETTRWTAAEMLWILEPHHPATGARRILDLGLQISGHPVALMVAILPKPNHDVAVLLRLYPLQGLVHLPPGLHLAGLSETGVPFSETYARAQDNYIQLYFSATAGERFGVQVELGEATMTEYFAV